MADLPNGPDGRPQYGERIPGYVPPSNGQTSPAAGIPQYGTGAPVGTPQPGQEYNPYGAGFQPYTPPPSTRTNTLAIIALISVFFVTIVGIVLGHVALSQIKKTGESGRGLAIAALIVGYISLAISVVFLIVLFSVFNGDPDSFQNWLSVTDAVAV